MNWVADVAMVLKNHPVFEEFCPLKISMAARPATAWEGQVRVLVTKARSVVTAEFVSIDGLNR